MQLYRLPRTVCFAGCEYALNTDFRVMLEIIRCLEDRQLPEILRWRVALRLFYDREVLPQHREAAMAYLAEFLCCGQHADRPGVKLLDWQQDADAIISGVNAAAGCEVRALEQVHWWTFLSWFHAMPPGQLSTVISIRDKLRRGQKLESWEKDFYRENRQRVDLRPPETGDERLEKQRLNRLLGS